MSEQAPTKDLVSFDDLKRAIEVVHRLRTQSICHEAELRVAERDAWRVAFEWRDKDDWPRLSEYVNGLELIRDKLR